MTAAFRYNRDGRPAARPPRGYVRWLRFWLGALALPLRGRPRAARLVWAEDAAGELLAAGFPSLLAVPAPLFADAAALFPGRLRLRAESTEEALLAQLRRAEARCGERFDWDAFLAACERQNRRAGRLRAAAEVLASLAPRSVDARTPQTALRSIIPGKEI